MTVALVRAGCFPDMSSEAPIISESMPVTRTDPNQGF